MDYMTLIIAIIAAAICYQLYVTLGRKSDHKDDPEPGKHPGLFDRGELGDAGSAKTSSRIGDLSGDEAATLDSKDTTDIVSGAAGAASAAPGWVNDIRKRYPGFDDARFLEGAKSAYEMIVTAFGTGDLSSIKPFIQNDIYTAFSEAITARNQKGYRPKFQFVGIESAEVTGHEVTSKDIFVSVAFTSDQIRCEYDADDNLVEGDPNRIDFVKDHWRFHRAVSAKDPNWVLVATGLSS